MKNLLVAMAALVLVGCGSAAAADVPAAVAASLPPTLHLTICTALSAGKSQNWVAAEMQWISAYSNALASGTVPLIGESVGFANLAQTSGALSTDGVLNQSNASDLTLYSNEVAELPLSMRNC